MNRQTLMQYFAAVDIDHSGDITAKELQRVFQQGNIQLSLESCAALIRMHDRDGSGSVSFAEFESMHMFISSVQQSFFATDKTRKGYLSQPEVKAALGMNGFQFDEPAFRQLMISFDPDQNNVTTLNEYLSLACFLASSRSIFQAFDPQRSGMIHLTMSQFVYVAALLRG
mmetsp:Transcript_5961/g.10731  ORF Transcript_5961/g.10731 Transcript_5961/m.10731 type:complete len:170 (+) Transcript_5961:124-633(+)|eukprot:CAMPEP_0184693088 /NCGR_PEP_ID=MMETSP0313-20130426/1393_1 /TAXON_ID=2792 /ORGANISM="Porphyridium aerugineum, Strain SAG 1380-2" /LENGTH=169 /DNA_ID=CAMNT_0027151057 /DNA_START=124 /DNA_END=633 /DNA_ORIENTATION=-